MAAYGENRPVMVAAAEGRELIDVEGRRYLDAISSLWVTTLGHRVPELDAALWSPGGTALGEHIEVLVNDAVLGVEYELDSPLKDGDRLTLLGQFMGG